MFARSSACFLRVFPWTWTGLALALALLPLVPAGSFAQSDSDKDKQRELFREGVKREYGQLDNKVVIKTRDAVMFKELITDPQSGAKVGDPKTQEKAPVFSIYFVYDQKDVPADWPWVLIGDYSGKNKRYIHKQHVELWRSRYALKPHKPVEGEPTFVVQHRTKDGKEGTFTLSALPSDVKMFAFVLQPANESVQKKGKRKKSIPLYEILFCPGVLEGETPSEKPKPKQVGLEIVFVLESSDFMAKMFGDKTLLDHLKDVVQRLVLHLDKEKQLTSAVRLGFVQYWDNVPWQNNDRRMSQAKGSDEEKRLGAELLRKTSPLFPASVTCDLIDDPKQFLHKINEIRAVNLYDDWPDDVMAGLVAAVERVKWSQANKQSVKHIILIGSASFQLPKGSPLTQFGTSRENRFTRYGDIPRGFCSTGLSISQLLLKNQPPAGKIEELEQKYFHALFLPNEKIDLKREPSTSSLDDRKLLRLQEWTERLIKVDSETELDSQWKDFLKEGFTLPQFLTARRKFLIEHQASLAQKHYDQLCKGSREDYQGFFHKVEDHARTREAADTLAQEILKSFRAARAFREKKDLSEEDFGPFSKPFYQMSDSLKNEFKTIPPSLLGKAHRYSSDLNHEVADEVIFVMRAELIELEKDLKLLLEHVTKRADLGKDKAELRRELLTALGAMGLGQKLKKFNKNVLDETPLKQLIADLPLASPAFDITIKDIENMEPRRFQQWLDEIRDAIKNCNTLHLDSAKFAYLGFGDRSIYNQYAFFPLSMLP